MAKTRTNNPNSKIRARYDGLLTRDGKWNGEIKLMEGNLNTPRKRKKPTVYCIWNDLFHEKVPCEFIDKAFETMRHSPQHIFLILTKRPGQMHLYFQLNPKARSTGNIWTGVTVEIEKYLNRIVDLDNTGFRQFVSIEPMLGEIRGCDIPGRIDWVILGGESGPNCRTMDLAWARNMLGWCRSKAIPFFFKQVGGFPDKKSTFEKIPQDLRVRERPEL